MSEWLSNHVDELYERCGIGVITGDGNLENMMFIAGAGYNFYDEHWSKLYDLYMEV